MVAVHKTQVIRTAGVRYQNSDDGADHSTLVRHRHTRYDENRNKTKQRNTHLVKLSIDQALGRRIDQINQSIGKTRSGQNPQQAHNMKK